MESYLERVFGAVAKLIRERDPELDASEINREAQNLIKEHVWAELVHSVIQQHSAPKSNELEKLRKQAEGLAAALESMSPESDIILRFVTDSKLLPNLSCLQRDARFLSEALLEGLKNMPPPRVGRRKDLALESLIEEATKVFELAYGVNLKNLPNLPARESRNIKTKYFEFVRAYMPTQRLYASNEQFNTLKKFADRYLSARSTR